MLTKTKSMMVQGWWEGSPRNPMGEKPGGRVKKKRVKAQPQITCHRSQNKPIWGARTGEKPRPVSGTTTEQPRAR